MQITIKLKYRSNCRAATEHRNSNLTKVRLRSFFRSALTSFDWIETAISNVDEKLNTIPGVNALNHFFDLRKELPEPISDAPLSTIEAASEKVEKATQLDQLQVEEVQLLRGSRIVMHTDPRSAGADRFRFLRMCLREFRNAGKVKTLQITSPLPQDGKSTVALNLATALSEGGRRTVLLIEADLHRPTLIEHLGLEKRVGLAECLEGTLNPISVLRRLEPLGWYLLPAGEPRSNPTELLQTEAFAGVLQTLSPHFDWVVIDSPPVIPLTDALSLARQADATLLIAREGRTPREAVEKAIAILGRKRVLGIVLNAVEGLDRMYSGYYGPSGYSGNYSANTNGRAENGKTSLSRPALPAKHSLLNLPE